MQSKQVQQDLEIYQLLPWKGYKEKLAQPHFFRTSCNIFKTNIQQTNLKSPDATRIPKAILIFCNTFSLSLPSEIQKVFFFFFTLFFNNVIAHFLKFFFIKKKMNNQVGWYCLPKDIKRIIISTLVYECKKSYAMINLYGRFNHPSRSVDLLHIKIYPVQLYMGELFSALSLIDKHVRAILKEISIFHFETFTIRI